MPIRNAIWKVGAKPQLLTEGQLPSEKALEDMIVAAPSGRRVRTAHAVLSDSTDGAPCAPYGR